MSPARRRASEISRAVGDVVFGRYKRLRLSQADLVARTGISVTTMRRLIAGEAEFDVDQLVIIARALGATAADILWEAESGLSDGAVTTGGTESKSRKEPASPRSRADGLAHLPYAAIQDPELDRDNLP